MHFPAGIKLAFASLIGILTILVASRMGLSSEDLGESLHSASSAAITSALAYVGAGLGVSSGTNHRTEQTSFEMKTDRPARSLEDKTFDSELDSPHGLSARPTATEPAKGETLYTTEPAKDPAPIDSESPAANLGARHHAGLIRPNDIAATCEPQLILDSGDGPQAVAANPPALRDLPR